MTCPPCNNDCRQGRDCPARKTRTAPRPLIAATVTFALFIAAGIWAQIELRAGMDWNAEQMESE